ncbi:MAG: hypothetical protein K9N23_18975, partial [Akkermansiaceae bacterium]|nr:hypothetical protein [Akkermansiaceae bacterium]
FEILRNTYGTAAKEVLPTLYTWQENLPAFQADGSIPDTRYENIEANIASTIAALEANSPPPALNYFKTVNVADANLGISLQSTNSVQLSASATDLDGGVPRFAWSKLSGPGPVSFSSNGTTGSFDTIASFTTVGSYVLRVSVTDSSIMDEVIWWKPHRLLGYYDFQTYDQNYGTVSTDVTVEVYDDINSPPGAPGGLAATGGDALVDLSWNPSFRATSYHVKRATTPGGPYSPLASPVTTIYQDTTVVNGTIYYYVVSAVNEFGESSDSTETGTMPGLTPLRVNVNLDVAARAGLVGPAGGLGETWNQVLAGPGNIAGLEGSSLLDANGTVTSVGFTCSAGNLYSWGGPALTLLTGGTFNWTPGDSYTLTIGGLTIGKKYDLSLVSFHPNEDGSRALFSTSNPTDTSSPRIVDNGGAGGNSSTWVEGVNYARFLNVDPDESATINLTIDGEDTTGNRRRAYLSGFQLMEAAEAVETYALTVNSGDGGGSYHAGETVPITANPAPSGREFDVWVVNAGSPSIANVNAATTTLTMPAGAATITATYKNMGGGPAGYTWSANEGQTVNFAGTVDVAYGANGQFSYLYGVTGNITFNNATFGDPIGGVVKAGYYRNTGPGTGKIKVFLLAGQSNMEGQGVVSLNDPQNYNGGLGNLDWSMVHSASAPIMTHLKDAGGAWVVRDDVKVWFKIAGGITKGGLTVGFTGYGGQSHIGPELQFGHVMGDQFDEPVLLIKTAWGGKSLYVDFRPPSSGGQVGPCYTQMLAEFNEALADLPNLFPGQSTEYEIAGFVWQQGWNDMVTAAAIPEYEQNLVNLVDDLRLEFNLPKLPVVIGELGNGGANGSADMMAFRLAQRNAAARLDNTLFVETHDFARPPELSPNTTHGHHWYGNAESYFLIGNALGMEMTSLLAAPAAPRDLAATPGDAVVELTWSAAAGATSYHVKRATNSGGPFSPLASPVTTSYQDASVVNGTTYHYVVSAVGSAGESDDSEGTSATPAPAPSPFSVWAADPSLGLTAGVNDGPLDDADRDGFRNLLEFVLGGNPLVPSSVIRPTVSLSSDGTWVFEYERSNRSAPPATAQVVEYGSDLVGWTPVAIPATSADPVTITPGIPSDHVSVALPDLGAMGFARLKVTNQVIK